MLDYLSVGRSTSLVDDPIDFVVYLPAYQAICVVLLLVLIGSKQSK